MTRSLTFLCLPLSPLLPLSRPHLVPDANARLLLQFDGPGKLVVDSVSLFPGENVAAGSGMLNPWPFRADLLDALKALQPA